MSGGGGGSSQSTPASETASKQIESERYDLAKGINAAFLPQYVSEAKRDLSALAMGRANADIMQQNANTYLNDGGNHFAAGTEQNVQANARNTAILKAYGSAENNRIERVDSALRALNGTAEASAQGLLAQATRQSEEAVATAKASQTTKQAGLATGVSLLGAAAGVGYDKYKRGEWFSSKSGLGASSSPIQSLAEKQYRNNTGNLTFSLADKQAVTKLRSGI